MYFSLLYFAAVLPFQLRILSPTLGIIGILLGWLISFNPTYAWRSLKTNAGIWLPAAIYVLGAISVVYTANTENWGRLMVLKLPTLLLPLALGSSPAFSAKHIKSILLTFAYSTAFSSLILFGTALLRYWQDSSINYFFHQNFVVYHLISVHYFAMYCIFAFVIFLYYLSRGKERISWFSIAAMALLIAALFTGAARMQIATFLLVVLTFIGWHFIRQRKWKSFFLYQGLAIIVILILAFVIPSTKKRIRETYREWMVYEGISNEYQTNHRVFIWRDALKVIENQPTKGTGLGSADDALYEYLKLEKAEFWRGNQPYTLADSHYNYHNEYLQHFAALGILGLATLLILFAFPLFKISQYSFLSYMVLMIMAISFITESMLERQAGTLFLAFFYGLLISNFPNKNRPSALSHHKQTADIS